ncbi:MAG: maleylacetoacetate isomerase [Myxococcales bacterium]|nr:maleylacetoacetate isomerase [Myxococcales bacterium]MCB9731405.1 maleylacetoacetate isomerase [Deltaproteobacteria bacterium]
MSAPYQLYSYFRSSASYRVRTALYWKGIRFDYHPVNLVADGGQQFSDGYRALNPMSELPTLVVTRPDGAEVALAQSVAILEYLEEAHPERPLLPADPVDRARVRQLVQIVNSSIQPLQNLKVLKRLAHEHGLDKAGTDGWSRHWIERGFEGLEAILADVAGTYAFGDEVTLADLMIVPQVYNAHRFACEMARFPTIARVAAAAGELDAFRRAHPSGQPDTPDELR